MKKLLIFANTPKEKTPYTDWAKEAGIDCVLVVPEAVAPSYGDAEMIILEPYFNNLDGEVKVLKEARERGVTDVYARGEKDILRAAVLRDSLGLKSGLSYADALPFRDKNVMKEHALQTNIPIAGYQKCEHILDVVEYADKGYPFVIKPLSESGSTGVSVIHNEEEFKNALGAIKDADFPILAESFVEGKVHHVDVLVLHNEVVGIIPSVYLSDCVAFQFTNYSSSRVLDKNTPLAIDLMKMANDVVNKFPAIDHTMYHIEFFVDHNGKLTLCEIACRPPGGYLLNSIARACAIDFEVEIFAAIAGKNTNEAIREKLAGDYDTYAGEFMVYARNAYLKSMNTERPAIDWIGEYTCNAIVGLGYVGPKKSGRSLVGGHVIGASPEEVEQRLDQIVSLINSYIQWEETTPLTRSFDELDGQIILNGDFISAPEAKIHVLNHGLHYASVVYEGIRVYEGTIFKLDEHLDRLYNSARIMGMNFNISVEDFKLFCLKLVERNKLVNGYLRPILWRGSETMATAAPNSSIHFAIATWEVSGNMYVNQSEDFGIKVQISDWIKPLPASFPVKAKCSALYAVNTLAKHTALDNGFDDAILLDANGFIGEASSANVFFVKNEELITPTTEYILNGITRQQVLEFCKDWGVSVYERDIHPNELDDFDGCFITGTAAEIKAVSSVNDTKFSESALFKRIQKAYFDKTKAPVQELKINLL
jgi:branched-chain amino acid aminotransferase